MAKRKRLTPARTGIGAPRTRSALPPIAEVAGQAALGAAASEVSRELEAARAEGRLAVRVPLGAIDEAHLVRDRLAAEAEALDELRASIEAHGQRVPIDLVELGDGRYGLVSGWRRMAALRALGAADALAVIRPLEGRAAAYTAMVEENEIRAPLSNWERARVALKSVEAGAFPALRQALQGLFGALSASKRSKIGSFATVVRALDGRLAYPSEMTERLGLALARRLDAEPGFADRAARAAEGAPSAAAEAAALSRALAAYAAPPDPEPAAGPDPGPAPGGISIRAFPGEIRLTGAGVTAALRRDLEAWLRARE